MGRRADSDHLCLAEPMSLDGARLQFGDICNRHGQGARSVQQQDLAALHRRHSEIDDGIWRTALDRLQAPDEMLSRKVDVHGDRKLWRSHISNRAGARFHFFRTSDDCPSVGKQTAPRGAQLGTVSVVLKKLHVQHRLKGCDSMTYGRLGSSQFARCPRKARLIAYRQERSELVECHAVQHRIHPNIR
jgi:hypothetical protein